MYTYTHSLFIKSPPQDIFDYISNPANAPNWQGNVESSEWTSSGQVGVGSTWRTVAKFLGRNLESTSEITSWDPPRSQSHKAVGGPIPFENTLTFEARDGGTQLTIQGQAEIGGFFKLAEGLVGKQLDRQLESDFSALKLLLEADPA